MRASTWRDYAPGEDIVREGEIDDRFYILVSGECSVERTAPSSAASRAATASARPATSRGARRTASIALPSPVTVLKVSATLLEQVSASCQLRFNRMFLKTLIGRLQGAEAAPIR